MGIDPSHLNPVRVLLGMCLLQYPSACQALRAAYVENGRHDRKGLALGDARHGSLLGAVARRPSAATTSWWPRKDRLRPQNDHCLHDRNDSLNDTVLHTCSHSRQCSAEQLCFVSFRSSRL